MAKPIAGPVFKIDDLIPCGCRVRRDEGSVRFRLWYCATHAAAFELVEAVRLNLEAMQRILKHVPTNEDDLSVAMDAEMRARAVLRKVSS